MRMNKKLIVATAACAALLIGSISTSLAWLVHKVDPVTNTFLTSDIEVGFSEPLGEDYTMIPGHTITKTPVAWVEADSVDAYLFVKIDESTAPEFDNYMTYAIASGWTLLNTSDGTTSTTIDTATNDSYVIYRVVMADVNQGETAPFHILANDKVSVKGSVTKDMMVEPTPTLTFTTYASQYKKNNDDHFSPKEAWDNITDPTKDYTTP